MIIQKNIEVRERRGKKGKRKEDRGNRKGIR
jgi:hypothetical protein